MGGEVGSGVVLVVVGGLNEVEICSCSGSNQMPKDVAIDQGSSAIVSSSDIH